MQKPRKRAVRGARMMPPKRPVSELARNLRESTEELILGVVELEVNAGGGYVAGLLKARHYVREALKVSRPQDGDPAQPAFDTSARYALERIDAELEAARRGVDSAKAALK